MSIDLDAIESWWDDVRGQAKDVDNCPDAVLRGESSALVRMVLHAAYDDSHVTQLIDEVRRLRAEVAKLESWMEADAFERMGQ